MDGKNYEYREGLPLANWAVSCLTAAIVTKFSAAVAACMRFRALAGVDAAEVRLSEVAPQGIVAMLASADGIAWILAEVFFFMWLFRAAANARALGTKGLSQSPCWSFVNYLIPVWRLVMPYFFLRELWAASVSENPGDPAAWKGSRLPGRVAAYFVMWFVAYVASSLVVDWITYVGLDRIVMPLLDNPSQESLAALADGVVPTDYARLQSICMAVVSGLQVLVMLFLRSYTRAVATLQSCRSASRHAPAPEPADKEGFGWPEPPSLRSAPLLAAFLAVSAVFSSFAAEPRLGVGMECLDRDLWDHAPAMPHLKELGIKRVRLQSGWARTEKEKGVYDFSWLDKVVDDLAAIGVEPWISLSYGNPIYADPSEGEQDYTGQKMFPMRGPAGEAAWKAYVTAIVSRYRDRVRIWEIWNEPDVVFFLKVPEGSSWHAEYARLVRTTAACVRAVQPDARIVACTAAGPCSGDRRAADLFEQEGVADCVDIYSFHAYQAIPELMSPASGAAFYASVRRNAPKVEFWRGEAGISSVKSGFGALSELPLSEEMQARWMSRHLVRDLADPQISFTSWFHLSAFEHFSHTRTYHYGVLREKDFSHKPSFDVLKRIRQFFDDGLVAPDATASLTLRTLPGATSEEQALATSAPVYVFRRNGLPMFAVTATWPAHEGMKPIKVNATIFTGVSSGEWKDPVLFDLVDGGVRRLKPSADGLRVQFELANHVRVVTEAAALAPHIVLEPVAPAAKSEKNNGGQATHE